MTPSAELEIGLRRGSGQDYAVEFRFTPPNSDSEDRLSRPGIVFGSHIAALWGLEVDSHAYGSALGEALLHDAHVATAFAEARGVARSHNAVLRVRLVLDESTPELNELQWECLRDLNGNPLFTGEQIVFSRFLSGWSPAPPRPSGELKGLVAVANPSNVEEYSPGGRPLPRIDRDAARKRAELALHGISITYLEAVTLDNLVDQLREGLDIFYLICHGRIIDGEPRLWLEDDQARAAVISGRSIIDRFRELLHKPRLVVLASCQSGGAGAPRAARESGEFAALGPRLAEAGVQAVLAMRGDLSVNTEAVFMPAFFRELLRDGQVDRAVARARALVRNRPDSWAPQLYMRVRNGRLWAEPKESERRGPETEAGRPQAVSSTGSIASADLAVVEKCLAREIGPIAGTLIENASRGAASCAELCRAIAREIGDEGARRRFLDQCAKELRMPAMSLALPIPPAPPASSSPEIVGVQSFDRAVIERARRHLSRFIGPLGNVVVDRSVTKVKSVDELYSVLAQEIGSASERTKFIATRPD